MCARQWSVRRQERGQRPRSVRPPSRGVQGAAAAGTRQRPYPSRAKRLSLLKLEPGRTDRARPPPSRARAGELAEADVAGSVSLKIAPPRPAFAREYGATDIVTARGDDGIARIK